MTTKRLSWWQKLVITLLILAGGFVLINGEWFSKQVNWWWQKDILRRSAAVGLPISAPNRIAITTLGISAPVVEIENTAAAAMQAGLAQGVVHYPGTAEPGQTGNAFYFGHSSDFPSKSGNYKTVFALLPNIELGDTVQVSDSTGRSFTYQVISEQVVAPIATEWLDQATGGRRLLTLQTSYPVGTALRRYIVQAELEK